ncbi:AraC family transcriptional regulator [Dyadobacter sp. NIV53]|uniref:AraC family transcriptional regulator n=1 Tax=Dyadobacter sp. NIV53 TaxID=2861765 RepID=UPI001C878186|nr:AraC family transcriptional regulator [Dyadobacter sp. NIV53]
MSDTVISRKRDGFAGQQAIVLPKSVVDICSETPPINTMYVTDMGFYPKAQFHYRQRLDGVPENILIYCVDGKGWAQMPDKGIVPIKTGEFLIIPTGTPHRYGADEVHPWSIFWMHLKGEQATNIAKLMMDSGKSHINAVPYDEERVRLFDDMYYTLEKGYGLDNLIYVNMTLWRFLVSFIQSDKFTLTRKTIDKDAISKTIDYMQESIHLSLKLDDFAAYVNISPSHYSALFKKKTGYAPIEYFNHLKIQKACQYLQFTDLRIGEIAQKIGISDQYYFSRLFRNIMESPPIEYRKKRLFVEDSTIINQA